MSETLGAELAALFHRHGLPADEYVVSAVMTGDTATLQTITVEQSRRQDREELKTTRREFDLNLSLEGEGHPVG